MHIVIDQLGKRFNRHWIFRGVSLEVARGESVAITGFNGSGKSTLIRILAGAAPASSGAVRFLDDHGRDLEAPFRHISLAAPYMDLIDEMTLKEFLRFHGRLRAFYPNLTTRRSITLLGPRFSQSTIIKNMSSGMKQRLRLLIAIGTQSELLTLDEPTTNLDEEGKEWYHGLLSDQLHGRTLLVASNEKTDFQVCERQLHLPDYH